MTDHPTERIGDLIQTGHAYTRTIDPKQEMCAHKDHLPDKRNLQSGRYKHTCPACEKTTYFEIQPRFTGMRYA